MRTVWKVNLNEAWTMAGADAPVKLPVGAEIIAAQYQHGDLCVWAIVDPDAETEDRPIHVIGTGNPIPDGVSYVDTVQAGDGLLVWHVFA